MTVEMKGPPSYQQWKACFAVYRNCFLMFDAVDLGPLIEYEKHFDDFYARFSDFGYPLLYQAETRTRREKFPRINREAYQTYDELLLSNNREGSTTSMRVPTGFPYDPARPWNYVFNYVLTEKCSQWWYKEMEYPGLFLLTFQGQLQDVI